MAVLRASRRFSDTFHYFLDKSSKKSFCNKQFYSFSSWRSSFNGVFTNYCHSRGELQVCNINLPQGLSQRPSSFKSLHVSSLSQRHRELTNVSMNLKDPAPLLIHKRNCQTSRDLSDDEVRKSIEEIADQFKEARELLEDAKEVEETVYFEEDMKEAQEAVEETLNNYQELLGKLNPEQKQTVTRTIGLKMEELKAQLDMIHESLKE